jgi:hypothetical protein
MRVDCRCLLLVASGHRLAKYVPLEQMADRSVIALCNLK